MARRWECALASCWLSCLGRCRSLVLRTNDNVVEYNVIAYAETYNITTAWSGAVGSGNVARNNFPWAGESGQHRDPDRLTATANTTADPGFAGRAAHDYRLLAPDGPCLATVGYDTAAKLAGERQDRCNGSGT